MPTLHEFIDTPAVGRRGDGRYAALLIVKDCETGDLMNVSIDGEAFAPTSSVSTREVLEQFFGLTVDVMREQIREGRL